MSSSASFQPDHHHHHHHLSPTPEQLCYVQCNFCETVLAVYIIIICMILYISSISCFKISWSLKAVWISLQNLIKLLWCVCCCCCRWVFLAAVCSQLLLFDVGTAPIFCLLTCVPIFFLLLLLPLRISFILAITSSLIKTLWYNLINLLTTYK